MKHKYLECYPISKEKERSIETFEGPCPAGYIFYGCPNPDVQSIRDDSGNYYLNANSGSPPLPNPDTNPPGVVGWNAIVYGENNASVTTKVATHIRRGDSPGFNGGPGPINPHQLSFTDTAKVKAIQAQGNHYMGYCLQPPPVAPTPITNVTSTNITTSGFTINWSGGSGSKSYTYTNNGANIIPSTDNGVSGNNAIFTGITSPTNAIIITGTSAGGKVTGNTSVTLLKPTVPPTVAPTIPPTLAPILAPTVAPNSSNGPAINTIETALKQPGASPTTVISSALINNPPNVVVAAVLKSDDPSSFTALINSPTLQGTNITITSSDASALYSKMSQASIIDTTKPLLVSIPSATGAVSAPIAGTNIKLAIDPTVSKIFPILNSTGTPVPGYFISVSNGIQTYITPTNPSGTVINNGSVLSLPTSDGNITSFVVADLDIVIVPQPVNTPPPVIMSSVGGPPSILPQAQCAPVPYLLYGSIAVVIMIIIIVISVSMICGISFGGDGD